MSDTQKMFLTHEELITLTGRKRAARQIEQLKRMRLPFFLNAADCPVVTRSAVEGRQQQQLKKPDAWSPAL